MSAVHELARKHLLDLQGEYLTLRDAHGSPLGKDSLAAMNRDQVMAAILALRERQAPDD